MLSSSFHIPCIQVAPAEEEAYLAQAAMCYSCCDRSTALLGASGGGI